MKIVDRARQKKIKGQTAIDILHPEKEGWVRLRFIKGDVVVKWGNAGLFIYEDR